MSARTTAELVSSIIEVDTVVVTDLSPFIDAAHHLVNRCCSEDDYTESELELIERWLAAHFYAVRDPRVSSEAVSGVSQSFQYQVGLNLALTTYGQQAMLLDTEGGLSALNGQVTAGRGKITPGASWIGTENYGIEGQ